MVRSIVEHQDDAVTAICVLQMGSKSGEPRFLGLEAHVPVVFVIFILLPRFRHFLSPFHRTFHCQIIQNHKSSLTGIRSWRWNCSREQVLLVLWSDPIPTVLHAAPHLYFNCVGDSLPAVPALLESSHVPNA